MCMQDLAINRAVTWQPIRGIYDGTTGYAVIPPNPRRVAISVSSTGLSQPCALRIGESTSSPSINLTGEWTTGTYYVSSVSTIDTVPGLPGMTLHALATTADIDAWEAVIDDPLGRVVEAMYRDLLSGGTANG